MVTEPAKEGVVEAVPEEEYSLQEERSWKVGCTHNSTGFPNSSLCTFSKDGSTSSPQSPSPAWYTHQTPVTRAAGKCIQQISIWLLVLHYI